MKEWQQQWDREIKGRHLYPIQNRVCIVESKGRNRKKEKTMTRLRIGHIKLNSTLHIIEKPPTGFCDHCHVAETVEQVLINCRKYGVERKDMMEEMER